MTEYIFGLVDVFAEEALGGNPLAVVEGADDLSDDLMRRISGEFNQAETTFLMKSARADWKLRSFTAIGVEVGGAGHNALGAWLWLADRGLLGDLEAPKTFRQEIGGHVLPITLSGKKGRFVGSMNQTALKLGPPITDLAPLAAALGLSRDDLLDGPSARAANTGAAHLMVRARDRSAVDRAEPNAADLLQVLGSAEAEGCYLYTIGEGKSEEAKVDRAYARFFNPTIGLWEDSATGTAAGPLCAYLAVHDMLLDGRLIIEQGTRMNRPSFLDVRLSPDPVLSGSGLVVARGTLHL
ncbi:MAG: PhzF family phenazine biosynthesis protein [Sphingosinicella sp.]|nr:PhzF family phenazine biosynthesis protein [Sphingosinicella sp.]